MAILQKCKAVSQAEHAGRERGENERAPPSRRASCPGWPRLDLLERIQQPEDLSPSQVCLEGVRVSRMQAVQAREAASLRGTGPRLLGGFC